MKLSELMNALNDRSLSLRRKAPDQIDVVGDVATLTPEIKTALTDHKIELLQVLPDPDARPKDRPAWWSDRLSDDDNRLVDDFMQYDPDGPQTDADAWEAALAGVQPCDRCGGLLAWWNHFGNQYCFRCQPPRKAMKLLLNRHPTVLRELAKARLNDPNIPHCGSERRRRARS